MTRYGCVNCVNEEFITKHGIESDFIHGQGDADCVKCAEVVKNTAIAETAGKINKLVDMQIKMAKYGLKDMEIEL